jgi:hypothetical protein
MTAIRNIACAVLVLVLIVSTVSALTINASHDGYIKNAVSNGSWEAIRDGVGTTAYNKP